MNATLKIVRYEVSDVARSRWLLGYTAFFAVATEGLLRLGDDPAKAVLSLMSIVLLLIPLVTLVFAAMYVYASREFTELLLAQPVARRELFAGTYLGLALPLSGAFVLGTGVPLLLRAATLGEHARTAVALLVTGVALTFAFTALALLIAFRIEDRVKGLGAAIGAWLVAAIVYDAAVLFVATAFADYPVERPLLALMLANPVDLARIVLLLEFDVAALMGYTGAVFKRFFGTGLGITLAGSALAAWIAVPALLGARAFRRKDF